MNEYKDQLQRLKEDCNVSAFVEISKKADENHLGASSASASEKLLPSEAGLIRTDDTSCRCNAQHIDKSV